MQTIKKTEKDSIRLLVGTFNDYDLRCKHINNQVDNSVLYFAEPYIIGEVILWRTPFKEKIRPFNNLTENEQDEILISLEKLLNKFNSEEKDINNIEKYFIIPSQSDIYIIEKKINFIIIITQWGSEPDDGKQKSTNIKNLIINNIEKQKDKQKKIDKKIKKEQEQEVLIIPDNANNFEFAMGKWKSTSNLHNSATKESVELFFEFDKNGKGTITLHEASGNKCISPLQLHLEHKILHIEQLEKAKCENKTHYVKHSIKCFSDSNNVATCSSETETGDKIIEFKLKKIE